MNSTTTEIGLTNARLILAGAPDTLPQHRPTSKRNGASSAAT